MWVLDAKVWRLNFTAVMLRTSMKQSSLNVGQGTLLTLFGRPLTTLYAFSPCWRRNKKYNRFTRKRKARVISTFQCTLCHNLVSRVFHLAKWKSLGRRLTASPWQPELHSAIFLACAAERKCSVSFRANEMIFLNDISRLPHKTKEG